MDCILCLAPSSPRMCVVLAVSRCAVRRVQMEVRSAVQWDHTSPRRAGGVVETLRISYLRAALRRDLWVLGVRRGEGTRGRTGWNGMGVDGLIGDGKCCGRVCKEMLRA